MNDNVTLPFDEAQRDPVTEPEPRQNWGSFRLKERVGRGGFGEVYRAWDPNLEREVALKLLLGSGAGAAHSDEEYKSMLREARALASVRHANIVSVYGIDRHDGRVGFWMDFVKGRTLSAVLHAQGPFGYREAALICLDVSRALSAVHRAGLLHRDIKAENVMREEGGRILLMDLGLSSLQHDQTNSSGTPNYMAPEIWRGEPATVESDIYAMGVLLYFLVTGEHPAVLRGLTTSQATEAIAKRQPLMDVRSDLPESFLHTVSTALESDPAKRFASAGQLAVALSECLGTSAPAELSAAPVAKKKNSIMQRWLIPVAGALFVLGAVAFAVPSVRQWLHLEGKPATASVSSSDNDQYIKAQELLKKSYKDQNVSDAIAIFQQILAHNPQSAFAKAGLGSAYFTQYRNTREPKLLDLAKSTTNDALKEQPDLASALATRARIEATTGQPDLALKDARDANNSDPRSPEALFALAEAYDAVGKKPQAIDTILKAIDLDENNTMYLVRVGNYYLDDGRLQTAAEQWKKAATIDPENVFALYDLGVVDLRLDRLDDARSNFQAVLKNGEDADTYRALGTVFMYRGDYRQAIDAEKKAIALNPKDQQSWANLGSTYISMGGDRDEANKAYLKAIELAEVQRRDNPNDAELLVDLADYYATIGDSAKSVPLVRKALALTPNDPKIVYFAGETYALQGDRTKAIPLIAKALAKGFPSNEFEHDPELTAIRNDPAFETALKSAQDQDTSEVATQTH